MTAYHIQNGDKTFAIKVNGRIDWALQQLLRRGVNGCTPIDTPAPRWSAYVHELRKLGVDIVTVDEQHGGPFPGIHARYVLRSTVSSGPNAVRPGY